MSKRVVWPKDADGDHVKYVQGEKYRVYGIPRCPEVQDRVEWRDDHGIGTHPGCNTCRTFAAQVGKRPTPYNFGSAWQWIRKAGLVSSPRPSQPSDTPTHDPDAIIANMEKMVEEHNDEEVAAKVESTVKKARKKREPEPKSKVPLLVQRRWKEDRAHKRPRNG